MPYLQQKIQSPLGRVLLFLPDCSFWGKKKKSPESLELQQQTSGKYSLNKFYCVLFCFGLVYTQVGHQLQ